MVIKELYELWRKDNLLTQALGESHEMLERTGRMFHESVRSLRHADSSDLGFDIYEEDRKVNRYEQDVRRKVLKHLAITGTTNAASGLVLVSVVIDIERVGDYTKNIVELAVAHPARLDCGKYEADTTRIEMAVAAMFHQIVPVMKQYDEARARTLIQDSVWIRKRSDEIVVELIKGSDPSLTRGDAVAIALYVRYLKRIGAHLMNVLSSVVNPFERIGFHVEEND